jgi:hypothetical protein
LTGVFMMVLCDEFADVFICDCFGHFSLEMNCDSCCFMHGWPPSIPATLQYQTNAARMLSIALQLNSLTKVSLG